MKNNKCEYIYIIFIEMKRYEFYYRYKFYVIVLVIFIVESWNNLVIFFYKYIKKVVKCF